MEATSGRVDRPVAAALLKAQDDLRAWRAKAAATSPEARREKINRRYGERVRIAHDQVDAAARLFGLPIGRPMTSPGGIQIGPAFDRR